MSTTVCLFSSSIDTLSFELIQIDMNDLLVSE